MRPEKPVAGYERLRQVLDQAYEQASKGKGKERHATDEAFEDQQIVRICKYLGSAQGAKFQAVKKIIESERLGDGAAMHELLGAIVYIAAAIIVTEDQNE